LKAQELIGNEIVELRCKISRVKYDGSIPLEDIVVEMKLISGETITFPHHPEGEISKVEKFNSDLKRIFPQKSIFKMFTKPNKFENLKSQKIGGIWLVDDDFGNEICSLEFENGYFLIKGSMSPIGTGNADLFLFESKREMEKKYEGEIRKLFWKK